MSPIRISERNTVFDSDNVEYVRYVVFLLYSFPTDFRPNKCEFFLLQSIE